MTWTLRQTDKALDDLADILDYIALDNPPAAEKLVTDLLALFDQTRDYPLIGRTANEIAPGYRILTHRRYLMIYRVRDEDKVIELIRVVHSARDWPNLFDN